MRSTDDYPGEMPAPLTIDDLLAEDLLAGRPVSPDLAPVATVVRALREVAEQPVTPCPELAARMAAGGFATTTVAGPPPAGRRQLRAVAQWLRQAVAARPAAVRLGGRLAAAGIAVSVVGVGTAGFAGSLPEPVQWRFESVVESVTPYRFSEPAGGPQIDSPRSRSGQEQPVPAGEPPQQRGGEDGRLPVQPEPAGPEMSGPSADGPDRPEHARPPAEGGPPPGGPPRGGTAEPPGSGSGHSESGGAESGSQGASGLPGGRSTPGGSGEAPGQSGQAPGRSGEAPGQSGQAPGRSGEAPGQSGDEPEPLEEAPDEPAGQIEGPEEPDELTEAASGPAGE